MELLWEYIFPIISLGAQVKLQKGPGSLVGIAIADYPDMPPSVRPSLLAERKMFFLPQSARTRRVSFFEVDLKRKQIAISPMIVPNISGDPFRLIYDRERVMWLITLERLVLSDYMLEIYEIHPEEDPQWTQRALINGKQINTSSEKQCITFWKAKKELQCLFLVPDEGETDDAQVFWATLSLQTGDIQEKIQQIGYTDAIAFHLTKQGCLLFLYQRLLDRIETPFSDRTGSGKWQLSCIAYDNTGQFVHQEIIPQLTTHIRDLKLPDHDLFEAFLLQVVIENGPLYGPQQQPTCVVVATRQEKNSKVSSEELGKTATGSAGKEEVEEPLERIGRLLWMDQQGYVISAEDGLLGEQVTISCCGEVVVGTDLLEGQWRLWHWVPSAKTGIQIDTYLSKEVVKATVLSEESGPGKKGAHFWCLEQYASGLRVVQRESEHGNEVTALWCEGFTLLYYQTEMGIRTEKCQGVVLSQGRLALLGQDQDEKIKLLCIQ